MRALPRALTTLCGIAILASLIHAQETAPAPHPVVPRLVNFSGKAADEQGKVLSGVVGATFAIYKAQTGGSPLWLEMQNVTAAKGNYTAQLGATKPEGLPLDVFASGDARWLGVSVNGGAEQPRVLLMSVPYALKAADAQTLGGLPASAFVLAPLPASGVAASNNGAVASPLSSPPPPATSNVTTSGGTVNAIPLFTTASNVQNSILTQTGTTAVNVAGKLNLPAVGAATATAGKNSRPESFVTSVFNSKTGTAVPQSFQLQAEPASNNTAGATGTLNLLFGQGTAAPAETGLKIAGNGRITFATGQTFPGTGSGTVQSVGITAPASDFTVTGSPITASGTLALAWTVPPDSNNTPGAIAKRDSSGRISVGSISASNSTGSVYPVYAVDTSNNNTNMAAIYGTSNEGVGVYGQGASFGLRGSSPSYGVWGVGTNQAGVYATSTYGDGVLASGGLTGVEANGTSYGVYATSASVGVYSYGAVGVSGASSSTSGIAVSGVNDSGGIGVYGEATNGGYAADFSGSAVVFGDLAVHGNLSKSGGSFKIDHPLDPANKYLYHSFVESPDMMNIYNGNTTLDAEGEAVVQLPDWFEALNREFRYTLTAIGAPGPNLYIADKVNHHQFRIAGGHPGMEVSWQVTGIRQDAWANAHRIPVEVEKPQEERGTYLNPELYGARPEQSLNAKLNGRAHQQAQRTLKQAPSVPLDRGGPVVPHLEPNR